MTPHIILENSRRPWISTEQDNGNPPIFPCKHSFVICQPTSLPGLHCSKNSSQPLQAWQGRPNSCIIQGPSNQDSKKEQKKSQQLGIRIRLLGNGSIASSPTSVVDPAVFRSVHLFNVLA